MYISILVKHVNDIQYIHPEYNDINILTVWMSVSKRENIETRIRNIECTLGT